MKVYFSAAITYRNKMRDSYKEIKSSIISLGYECLESFDVMGEDLDYVLSQTHEQSAEFVRRWNKVVGEADMAVLETSYPGTVNMGFEASAILEKGKPVVAMCKKGQNPSFLGDFHSKKFIKLEYDDKNIRELVEYGLNEAKEMLDRRFTMIISPAIDDHLEKVADKNNLSRSEYIRELIRKDMEK